ncbi:MAG: ATP-binding cassette domain-containing protein [Actinomycetales bacterium]|nr:ATP-binding cassette domain-containing protein [Actinomycetales bacterium]
MSGTAGVSGVGGAGRGGGGAGGAGAGGSGAGGATAGAGLEAAIRVERGGFALEVELSVAPGRTLAILGPNGAGKSTLLAALAGLLPPVAGRIALDDAVLDDVAAGVHRPPEERRLGVVFQGLLLFPHRTVVENLAFPLRVRGMRPAVARAAVAPLLERFDLGPLAERRPAQLSGGQAQRVALARALAAGPRALLLDEPTASLDVEYRAELRAELRARIAESGLPTVVVTHDPEEASALGAALALLEGGVITQRGASLAAIREHPSTTFARRL